MRRLGPDAVLTDIRMPPGHHMEGIEAAHAIRARAPGVGVVGAVPAHRRDLRASRCFRDGTAGLAYLLKDRLGDVEDLIRALREVARGRIGDRPDGRRRAGGPAQPGARRPRWPRSRPRELDVLREMAQGKTNAGIEQALHLSASTVEKHVNSIFGKLGLAEEPVHRRVAAVLAFLQDRG